MMACIPLIMAVSLKGAGSIGYGLSEAKPIGRFPAAKPLMGFASLNPSYDDRLSSPVSLPLRSRCKLILLPLCSRTSLGEPPVHPSAASHHVNRKTTTSSNRRWILGVLALATLAGVAPCNTTSAQTPSPAVKLYIFDLGQLKSANPQPLLDRGVTVTDMSVVAYLVVHPRGTLLWDSGTIPDELVKPEGTTIVRATVKKTLTGQLAEIGYKPADVTYLALSHYHYDHSANANAFAGSTWLVQRPERAAMFPDTPPTNPIAPDVAAKFSALKTAKTMLLDGDHDVFGDGSVMILSTPGHTPGHQSLFVRLPKTGALVLSGDAVHFQANWDNRAVPSMNVDQEQTKASMERLAGILAKEKATLWINHDKAQRDRLQMAPGFYE